MTRTSMFEYQHTQVARRVPAVTFGANSMFPKGTGRPDHLMVQDYTAFLIDFQDNLRI